MSRTRLEHHWHPSPNVGPRQGVQSPDLIILHYTGMETAQSARDWLCKRASSVSCHYLIDEKGSITQMVDESLRAWHAGAGSWKGRGDINSRSIGIEIHNPGPELGYPDFPEGQIEAVIELCRDIQRRYGMWPESVLAHSDVAPLRKSDPGEKFPWRKLYSAGVGHWVEPQPIEPGTVLKPGDTGDEVARLRSGLVGYGYDTELSGSYEASLAAVVTAFQRHFRQELVDGLADSSTVGTLQRLLDALPQRSSN
jgi:N-acetylmuramoyl-L-alanine amidase